MSKTSFKLTVKPTFRDYAGRFTRATEQLHAGRRDMVRDLAKTARDLYQEEAPVDTGDFRAGIRYRTFTAGNDIGFSISTPQPLGKFIIGGTKAHIITPRGNYPLRFATEDGSIVFTYLVNHPGTKPNPFNQRAIDRFMPDARAELARLSTRFATEVTGR
jgi:hypothetical protein